MENKKWVRSGAFTILEVMVATVVLALMLGIVFAILGQTSAVTGSATAKITAFQEARAGFDLLTQRLSQATLNSYWDYDNPVTPSRYLRKSELHFLIGNSGESPFPGTPGTGQAVAFQSPSGLVADRVAYGDLDLLLNATAYFVEYSAEPGLPPPFPASSAPIYRYRLMQAVQPSERFAVYASSDSDTWVSDVSGAGSQIEPIAENVVYVIVWPRRSPADDPGGTLLTANFGNAFAYDSLAGWDVDPQPINAHQLPPVLQVTMIAIDEPSAQRICTSATPPSAITSAFNGIFDEARQEDFDADLETLEERFAEVGINFRVFNTLILLRESKME